MKIKLNFGSFNIIPKIATWEDVQKEIVSAIEIEHELEHTESKK